MILDGEIAVLEDDGKLRFQLLQCQKRSTAPVCFYLFGVLGVTEKKGAPRMELNVLSL